MAKKRLTRGESNARWIEEHCRVPEGKLVGQPVRLRPWQREVICGIYDSPTRRAIISFGRKNGKTALSAFLLLLHLCGPEAKVNSQLFSAAQSRDQAAVLYALAAKMVRLSPDLLAVVTIRETAKQLLCAELGTLYRALSADANTAYGLSPSFTVHDELGQVRGPRSELYEALETATGAQESPLSIIISTQAPTDADLLSVLIDDAKTGKDPRVKLFLYTADPTLDPFSVKAQKQANPALGDFLDAGDVKQQAEAARRMPSQEAGYLNLILNRRVSQTSPFIPRAVWEACAGAVDVSIFYDGRRVYGGLDLSARNDLTALALVAQDDDKVWHALLEFWAPKAGIEDRSHRDRAPYDVWAKDGVITATPGASIDYGMVAARLGEVGADTGLQVLAFDRWRIDVLKAELTRLGVPFEDANDDERGSGILRLKAFGQGFRDISPALDSLEAVMLNGKLRHGGNPCLTWNAANAITIKDPAGNRKLDKSKSTGRIDGMVALAMALGTALSDSPDDAASVYEERGPLVFS